MRAEDRGGHPARKHTAPAPVPGRRRAGTARPAGRRRALAAPTQQARTLAVATGRVASLCAAVLVMFGFGVSGRRAAGRRLAGRVRPVTGLVVACVLTAAALAPVDVAPANAAAAFQALKSQTLSAARDAAAANTVPVTEARAEVEDDQGAKKGQDPIGSGKVHPGQGTTVKAEKAHATIGFSGHKVASDVDVAVKELGDGAARTAATETGGTVLGTPLEVTATDSSGKGVTQFPADPVIEKHENGPSTVKDVNPGVTLELGGIDASKIGREKGKLDPATVRVYTRENAGEAWTVLPSYFDAKTGTVKAESTHLSQFVVIGTPFVPPAGPVIVLDPDDDVANTTGPNGPMTELPESSQLTNALVSMMQNKCKATVVPTRTSASPATLSRPMREGMAAAVNPDVTITLAFDALYGHPWGVSVDGGTRVYSRGGAADNALSGSLLGVMPGYTGRPANTATLSGSGIQLPYSEFSSLPGAVVHMETLYLDHNYDRPVIDNGFSHIVDGVFTGIGQYLGSVPGKQFSCTNPVTGGWPTKPSQAELAKWRNLGFHNYQAYGAEPVSFATGNLIEQYKLFTLAGPGQGTDLNLVYNSQDGRLTRTGAGVSFGLGAHAQRFSDGSVMVVGGDGASYVFTGNGAGGYTPDPGDPDTLSDAGNGQLRLASPQGEKWVFDASGIEGIGDLVSHTDRAGNTTTLAYAAAGPNAQFRPLAAITDAAGQTIKVGSDGLGRVTSFTLPDGRVWALAYDGAGNLANITDAAGGVRAFTYDGAHQLLTATDPLGVKYLTNTYDASGRVVKQLDAQGNVRSFAYDDAAKTTTYTDNEGHTTVYTHDGAGHVTQMRDANGNTQKFGYDSGDHATSYTDQSGNTTSYAYDASGRLTKSSAPGNDSRSYTYTPQGDLASVTDLGGPGGASRTTSFDIGAQGFPTAVHQPDGTTLIRAYDNHGNLTASTDANGSTTSYAYDGRGNLTGVTDPMGGKTTYVYDGGDRPVSMTDPNGNTSKYVWDALDHPAKKTDALGGVTSLAYDGNGHVVSMTDPAGAKSTYTWDALFRLTSKTDSTGAVTKYSYNREDKLTGVTDPLGAVTKYDVDPLGKTTKTTDPNGGTWAQAWNPTGTLASSTDPAGAVTKDSYDLAGRLVSETDPSGAATKYVYDPVGKLLSTTDPVGGVKSVAYDALDRVVTEVDQTGAKTSYTYDAAGNATKVTDQRGQAWLTSFDKDNRPVAATDPTGAKIAIAYDPAGNTTAVTDALGRKSTASYDALNRPVAETNPAGAVTKTAYDPVGRVLATTNPDGNTAKVTYTPRGELATATDPNGATTSYSYDAAGYRTGMVNPDKVITAYAYDPAGHLTSVTENAKASQPGTADTNVVTKYAYTPAMRLASVTDPDGHATNYSYDSRGLLTKQTNPLGNATSYAYDPRGLVASMTDGNGQTTQYGYTARGQLATTSYANGQTVKYGYDPAGALTTMEDPTGATGFTYTSRGQLASQTDTRGKNLGYTYDAAGELTKLALPENQTISYGYDPAGRMATENTPAGTLGYAYTPAGLPTTTTRSSGITTTYAHDADGHTTNITHATAPVPAATTTAAAAPAAPASADAVSCTTVTAYLNNRTLPAASSGGLPAGASITFNYAYDLAGNVTNRTRTTTGTPVPSTGTPEQPLVVPGTTPGTTDNRSYSYDPLNRLTKSASTTGATATYGYDPAGNRTAYATTDNPGTTTPGDALTVTAAYNAANQLTTETSTTPGQAPQTSTYSYDGNGNRTKRTTPGLPDTTNTYTPTNQPATTTQPGYSTTRSYDGLGRATGLDQTTTKGGTQHTDTLYNGLTPIQTSGAFGTTTLAPDNHGNTATTTNVNGGTTTSTWGVQDRLGSTIATTNPQTGTPTGPAADATLAQLADYTDTGTPQYATTGFNTGVLSGGYTGQGTDPTAGLTTFHARNYDPATSTFTGHDTWGGLLRAPQTLNHYAYTLNNPATWTDHLGYSTWNPDDGPSPYDEWQASRTPVPTFLPQPPAPPISIQRPDYTPRVYVPLPAPTWNRWVPNNAGRITGPTTDWTDPRVQQLEQQKIDDLLYNLQGLSYSMPYTSELGSLFAGLRTSLAIKTAAQAAREAEAVRHAEELAKALEEAQTATQAAKTSSRFARDIAISPTAPKALKLDRSIGRASHNQALQEDIASLPDGATEVRVNQQQVNFRGQRTGINRPDLQYTLNGRRYYVEYEGPDNPRGAEHEARILANDPSAIFILRIVP